MQMFSNDPQAPRQGKKAGKTGWAKSENYRFFEINNSKLLAICRIGV